MEQPATNQPQPQDAFSAHFASPTRYGSRWHQTLHPALLKQPQPNKALFYNRYTPLEDFNTTIGENPSSKIERLHFPSAPNDIQSENLLCYLRKTAIPLPEKVSNNLRPYVDIPTPLALAVHLLQILPGDKVLEHGDDGTVSVAMAQSIWPHLQPSSQTPPLAGAKKGCLHANWINTGSMASIATAFRDYLPASLGPTGTGEAMIIGSNVQLGDDEEVTEKPPLGSRGYDKVFVRSASLSEAGVAERRSGGATGAFATWPPAEAEMIAEAQVRILLAALGAVRFGGRVMFVSSSVAGEENEGIVGKAMALAGEAARLGASNWTAEVEGFGDEVEALLEEGWAERTEMGGWIVLPDHASGRREGPLFFCTLTKKPA